MHGAHRLAAVGVALHAEAGVDRGRLHGAEELGQPLDLRARARPRPPRPRPASGRARCSRKASKPRTWARDERPVDPAALDQHDARPRGPARRRCPAAAAGAARRARPSRCGAGRSTTSCAPRSRACCDEAAIWCTLVSAAFLPQKTISRALARSHGALCAFVAEGEPRGLEAGRPAQVAVGGRAAAEEPPERRGRRRSAAPWCRSRSRRGRTAGLARGSERSRSAMRSSASSQRDALEGPAAAVASQRVEDAGPST